MRLYWKLIGVAFRSQAQYRASFLMSSVAIFISISTEILGIWVLFDRFKIIKGWTLYDLMLIYGIIHMGFAVAEAFSRGFDKFSQMIKRGHFDRLLLRPLGTLFQVATSEIQMVKIGRFVQGLIVFIWGYIKLKLAFTFLNLLIIILASMGTAALFYGIFVIQASLTFFTTETLELMNIATYGGRDSGQYPITIYQPVFRIFFTFLIPIACVVYYPVAILLQQEKFPFWTALIFPLAGFLFFYLSCQFWKIGVRHYHSTGS